MIGTVKIPLDLARRIQVQLHTAVFESDWDKETTKYVQKMHDELTALMPPASHREECVCDVCTDFEIDEDIDKI